MLFIDGVFSPKNNGNLRFHRVNAPTSKELNALVATISERVARYLERQGWWALNMKQRKTMQHSALIAQLRTLKLAGMADAFEQQLEQPSTHDDLSFHERFSLLIDREACSRSNTRVARLLKGAQLKTQAQPDEVNYTHPRGLQKSAFAALLSGQWILGHQNVFLTGPTGCGKTYLGCVLATQACRQGYSVRYFRTSRLLETLSIAHHDGRFAKLIAQLAKIDILFFGRLGSRKTHSRSA